MIKPVVMLVACPELVPTLLSTQDICIPPSVVSLYQLPCLRPCRGLSLCVSPLPVPAPCSLLVPTPCSLLGLAPHCIPVLAHRCFTKPVPVRTLCLLCLLLGLLFFAGFSGFCGLAQGLRKCNIICGILDSNNVRIGMWSTFVSFLGFFLFACTGSPAGKRCNSHGGLIKVGNLPEPTVQGTPI